MYLSHPSVVTDIHWRRPNVTEHHDGLNVLYTICADYHVRVWAPTDAHSPHDLHRVAQIYLQDSIQPRVQPSVHARSVRYVCIVDGGDFERAVQGALSNRKKLDEDDNHKFDHLVEVSRRNPDLCVVLDNEGHMSAWGVDSIGCKARNEASVFNVAHVEHLDIPALRTVGEEYPFTFFETYCDDTPEALLTLLIHRLDENISWLEGSIEMFLDPAPSTGRLQTKAVWNGHERLITRMIQDEKGQSLLSCSSDGEVIIWQQGKGSIKALRRVSRIKPIKESDLMLYLSANQAIVTLNDRSLNLWTLAADEDEKVASCGAESEGEILCLFDLHIVGAPSNLVFVAAVDSESNVRIWKIHMPNDTQPFSRAESAFGIYYFCDSQLPSQGSLALVTASKSVSLYRPGTKAQAVSCTASGLLEAWTFRLDIPDQKVEITTASLVQTQVMNPSKISASAAAHTAVVDSDRTGFSIWNLQSEFEEFHQHFSAYEPIQHLDWYSTPVGQSMIAISLPYRIILLVQTRFDFLHNRPTWILVKEFVTKDFTALPIGDIAWLSNGSIVAGTGNQLFVYGDDVPSEDQLFPDARSLLQDCRPKDAFDLANYANGPLAIYYPQVLHQYILAAEIRVVEGIVIALFNSLKFHVPGDEVDSFLDLPLKFFHQGQIAHSNGSTRHSELKLANGDDEDDAKHLTEDLTTSLNESLTNLSSPHITDTDRHRLTQIIQTLGATARDFHSLDPNALRYILLFRQYLLHTAQKRDDLPSSSISYREYSFALHSSAQDHLTTLITKHSPASRLLWAHARASGLFMWLSDPSALHQQFESIARNEYTKTDEKSPTDCALYYLALRKKQVLLGLWRMAHWNREQRSTMRLLGNNFDEPRWKTAALKNAYALLGKRRFQYAASFFLLAGKCEDAVNVCVHQMGDLQLGVAVARVYEGDEGPTFKKLLKGTILPEAAKTNNRFQAHWAFWMLGEKTEAVRALHALLTSLVQISEPQDRQAMSYRNADPAHLIMHRELRHHVKNREDFITPKAEWDFVMRTVRLYCRMGCAVLALGLVRNYRFLERPKEVERVEEEEEREYEAKEEDEQDAGKSSSSSSNDGTGDAEEDKDEDRESESEEEPGGKKPPPTQFQEPSVSSLLDNFGF